MAKAVQITNIAVRDLFGHFDYNISDGASAAASLGKFIILYGENGSGKTTILKLLFCMFSTELGRGLKTYIAQVPFKSIVVKLSSGAQLAVRRKHYWQQDYEFSVRQRRGAKLKKCQIRCDGEGSVTLVRNSNLESFTEEIAKLAARIVFLPDHRRAVEEEFRYFSSNEPRSVRSRYTRQRKRTPNPYKISETERDHVYGSGYYLDVRPVLNEVSDKMVRQILSSASVGVQDTDATFLKVISEIAKTGSKRKPKATSILEVQNYVRNLGKESGKYDRYGRLGFFSPTKLAKVLRDAPKSKQEALVQIVSPYLEGIEARMNALGKSHEAIETFLTSVNSFLNRKHAIFDIRSGLEILDDNKFILDPILLSSGERQILLLLCNSFLSRDEHSIMLIDEPELSLNIKWQRRLLDSIAACAGGGGAQFLIATHSLEVISKHRKSIVRLQAQVN